MAESTPPTPVDPEQQMAAAIVAARRPPAAAPPLANVAAGLAPKPAEMASQKPAEVADDFDHALAANLAFIGSGQGGSRLAAAFWKLGYRRIGAFNTTDADFNGLPEEMPKLSLHIGGAGKDTELARRAFAARRGDVGDFLTRAWGHGPIDCALVSASLGGGTGTGTARELVRLARQHMADRGLPPRVGALVSLPPVAEGYQICRNAVLGFRELVEEKVSPLIVIDNARTFAVYKPVMSQAHEKVNDVVARLLHLFNQLAAVHSPYITFDRAELLQLLDSGTIAFAAADIAALNSPADVSEAIRRQLTANVLAEVDLSSGTKGGCLLVAHQDVLDRCDLSFFDAGFIAVDRMLKENVQTVVHRGLYPGSSPGLQAYVLVGGLSTPSKCLVALAQKGGLIGSRVSGMADFLGVSDG